MPDYSVEQELVQFGEGSLTFLEPRFWPVTGTCTSTRLIGHWQACCTRTMIVDVDTVKKPGNARRLREIIASVSDSVVLLLG
jgi:hypothetical protein